MTAYVGLACRIPVDCSMDNSSLVNRLDKIVEVLVTAMEARELRLRL